MGVQVSIECDTNWINNSAKEKRLSDQLLLFFRAKTRATILTLATPENNEWNKRTSDV